jgi:putative PIN family toxin of toxin-antitoxin system
MKVVLDTNCYISRLLTPNGGGAKLVDMMIRGKLQVFTSEKQIEELLRVVKEQFQEPKKPEKYIPLEVANALVVLIRAKAEVIPDRRMIKSSGDTDDNWIISIAINARADILVSQNRNHIYQEILGKSTKIRVMRIAEALNELAPKKKVTKKR